MSEKYEFTTDWFNRHAVLWESFVTDLKPSRILEIGSFEGRSTTFLIEKASQWNDLFIHCIDTWEGGEEHEGIDFSAVEERFDKNVNAACNQVPHNVSVWKHKGTSVKELAKLILETEIESEKFDLIYVDGSHMATDVFIDAAMSFPLLRVGGVMVFDDFLMMEEENHNEDANLLHHPQLAITAFRNIFSDKLEELQFRVNVDGKDMLLEDHIKLTYPEFVRFYQMYLRKIAE
jgi:cephalosporin hydroxylase